MTIPLVNLKKTQAVDNLILTLLDDEYHPLAKVEKKVILLNGEQNERIAIPTSTNAPDLEKRILRVDFMGNTWLKRFSKSVIEQELHIIGQNEWIAGSKAALRVIVTESQGAVPIEDARIQIITHPSNENESHVLAEEISDSAGTASLQFETPENIIGQYPIEILVQSKRGSSMVSTVVNVVSGTKIFLTTDKPVYQPGQLMRIRALARS